MLRQLHIRNVAVIEDATIELGEGLNCFTGQTGAGKSLVMGALEILLALRTASGSELLRAGASEARVSGLFELRDPWLAQAIAEMIDQPINSGDQLLMVRKNFRIQTIECEHQRTTIYSRDGAFGRRTDGGCTRSPRPSISPQPVQPTVDSRRLWTIARDSPTVFRNL